MPVVISYQLTAKARVSAGKAGEILNARAVHEVIPGAVIRGALGSVWWNSPSHAYRGGDTKEAFDRVFGQELRVGSAVPVAPHPARLEPLSWVRCKYPTDGCPRDWHDSARDGASNDESEASSGACQVCGRPFEHARGWVVPAENLVQATRTALDGGIAKSEQLFTRRALSARVRLNGRLELLTTPLAPVQEWLLEPKVIRVGGQLSTMGACQWTAGLVEDPPEPPVGDLVVRLRSPAILVDGYGAPSLDLMAAATTVIRESGGNGEVRRQWVRPEVVSGWHSLAGVPKPEEWAVAAGSVLLVIGCDVTAAQALAAGVGLRRQEGYGVVTLVPLADTVTFGIETDDPDAATLPPDDRGDEASTEQATPRTGPSASGEDSVEPAEPSEAQLRMDRERTPVERLLQRVAAEDQQAVQKGMLSSARSIKRYRDNGFPASVVQDQVSRAAEMPWARRLSGELMDDVLGLLGDNEVELATTIAVLVTMTGGDPR